MMNTIDCRNMTCPAPVISVKKALETALELRILLDDGAPRENVTRFARNRGYKVNEERTESGWAITVTADAATTANPAVEAKQGEQMLLFTSDRLGEGPEELGRLLMKNFIHTLLETSDTPQRIFFMNSGVFLPCAGSDVHEALSKLADMGVEILSCGLCLDFFGLKEKERIGSITNMLTTAECMLSSARVIKL